MMKIPCPKCGSFNTYSKYSGERWESGPFLRCYSSNCQYDEEEEQRKRNASVLQATIDMVTVPLQPTDEMVSAAMLARYGRYTLSKLKKRLPEYHARVKSMKDSIMAANAVGSLVVLIVVMLGSRP